MKDLRVKKTKMICSVKGCGARATYFLTKGGDFAGTPNICRDCLEKAYKNVTEFESSTEITEVITDDKTSETVQDEVITEDAVQEVLKTDEAAEEQISSKEPEKAETVKKSGGNSSKRKTAKKGDK